MFLILSNLKRFFKFVRYTWYHIWLKSFHSFWAVKTDIFQGKNHFFWTWGTWNRCYCRYVNTMQQVRNVNMLGRRPALLHFIALKIITISVQCICEHRLNHSYFNLCWSRWAASGYNYCISSRCRLLLLSVTVDCISVRLLVSWDE